MKKTISIISLIIITGLQAQSVDIENITKGKPLKISGNVSSNFAYYDIGRTYDGMQPFTYFFQGNLNFSWYRFSMPVSYSYSNQGNDFNYRVPFNFNRLSLHPKYRWITAHIGDVSMNFSRTHADEFEDISNIKFEFRFLDKVANRADLKLGNILYEFKSWIPGTNWWNNFFSGTGDSYNQFKTYLSSISSMDELKYIYDAKKIPGNATEAEAYMKDKFKKLFIAKAEDWFKPVNQGGLGQAKINQLFKLDNMDDILDADQFILLMNTNTSFRNNALKFIKIE